MPKAYWFTIYKFQSAVLDVVDTVRQVESQREYKHG